MTTDPERLADGGGSEALRELCAAAERDDLDDRAVERVRAGLAAKGLGNPGGPTATAAAGRGIGSIAVKLGALSALLGGVLGLLIWSARSGARTPPAAPSPPASTSLESPAAPTASPPPVPDPAPSAQPPAPTAAGAQRPTRATPKPVASAPATSLPSASAAAPTPREGLLLLRARQVLDTDPARALAFVEQHEREFPKSQLAPERAALRRQAEARLGR